MRLLTLFCVVAMAVAFAMPAQAAVQNVKVSGDLTMRGIFRDKFDLTDDNTTLDSDAFLMSTVGVNVEADLTDNVSAMIRVVNQRDIDTDATTDNDIDIDLAYITFQEMLYSPLTVTIGRQDLWVGDGFLVGARLQDGSAGITASEFTDIISFDAVKAVVDYDPWTITGICAKIAENITTSSDDEDLAVLNIGYIFEQYEAEAEGYYIYKKTGASEDDEINTIGLRGSGVPLENLELRGEFALQFGDYDSSTDREAWAIDVSGEYTFVDIEWVPVVGLEYVYLSGEEATPSGDYEAFDRLYYGKTYSAIREWQDVYYTTTDTTDTAGNTNEHMIIISASAQPIENLTASAKYIYFMLAEDDSDNEDELGSELDLELTYDYTEDVTFGLLAAWFFPGDVFTSPNDDDANLVVGTVSLAF